MKQGQHERGGGKGTGCEDGGRGGIDLEMVNDNFAAKEGMRH